MSSNETYTVKEIVTRLEAKVDRVIDDHEKRIRILERFSNRWSGALSLVLSAGALVGAVAAIVVAIN